MRSTGFQLSLTAMLGLIACVAVNIWLFRVGFVWGLVGLNVSKHVGVAFLCQAVGLNREVDRTSTRPGIPPPHPSIKGSS